MLIQYILVIIIIFIIFQTAAKFRARQITGRESLFWIILWLLIGAVVLLPKVTSFLALYLGVGRGADLVIYSSLIFIFYIIFRLFIRQEKLEKDISKIVEHLAMDKNEKQQK